MCHSEGSDSFLLPLKLLHYHLNFLAHVITTVPYVLFDDVRTHSSSSDIGYSLYQTTESFLMSLKQIYE